VTLASVVTGRFRGITARDKDMSNVHDNIRQIQIDADTLERLSCGTTAERRAFNLFINNESIAKFAATLETLVTDIQSEVAS
jgi:hypothetical protein